MAIAVNVATEVGEMETGTMEDDVVTTTSADHGRPRHDARTATVDARTPTTEIEAHTTALTASARAHPKATAGPILIDAGVRVPTDAVARNRQTISSAFPAAMATTSLMCRFL